MLALSRDGRCFATSDTHCDIALWNTQTGTHITTLDYAGHIFSLAFLSDSQLASGNRDELSESGRASYSYTDTDYDAFVMLCHVHFILYTSPVDGYKLYWDLNIDEFSSNILPSAYWVF